MFYMLTDVVIKPVKSLQNIKRHAKCNFQSEFGGIPAHWTLMMNIKTLNASCILTEALMSACLADVN